MFIPKWLARIVVNETNEATDADDTDRHSKASHAVFTAPPPDNDAIKITPGTQILDNNALINPSRTM
jgi:hypothetical protein